MGIVLEIKKAVNRIRYHSDPVVYQGRGRRYVIKCPVPPDAKRESWGDFHFATALARAINRKGNYVRVDLLSHWYKDIREHDINIVLRGLSEFKPQPNCVNIMWNISHPSKVKAKERFGYDHIFSCGFNDYSEMLSQASDPRLFRRDLPNKKPELSRPLFVGNARGGKRDVVMDCLSIGQRIYIIGAGWDKSPVRNWVIQERVPNEELPQWYQAAPFVLNDHHEDMHNNEFISNRVYDALSVGTQVIQPYMSGWAEDYFKGGLLQYCDAEELAYYLNMPTSTYYPPPHVSLSMHDRADIIMKRAESLFSRKFLVRYRDGQYSSPEVGYIENRS